MKLAIADPPYLGRGARFYGPGANGRVVFHGENGFKARNGERRIGLATTEHDDADEWDQPKRHAQLIADLDAGYDGYAIAASRDSLPVYLAANPALWVAVWHRPDLVPGGHLIVGSWEPVLVRTPRERRSHRPAGFRPRDVLTATAQPYVGHVGAKPRAWTRWVLDMLGYNPDEDTVTDLFPGSGAVTAEIAQGTLL